MSVELRSSSSKFKKICAVHLHDTRLQVRFQFQTHNLRIATAKAKTQAPFGE
jgi:hypothetical protein